MRRLSGIQVETSAVFNMATQFGGGKSHSLTALYHLARNGEKAKTWSGVDRILRKAEIKTVPEAAVAVFMGKEFDSLQGRGGGDEPVRKTPWGEIAWQIGGAKSFAVVEQHEREFIEPKGDAIRAMLPKDRPVLILMDEIINYVSTYRKKGYGDRLYNFLDCLAETARGEKNVAVVVSIPASELEYTTDDIADETRFKKMLDRLGKAIMMSADTEMAEIIRRRLFDWHGMPEEAEEDGDRLRGMGRRTRPGADGHRRGHGAGAVPGAPTRSTRRCCRCSSENGRACHGSSGRAAFSACWPCGWRTTTRKNIARRPANR